MVTYDDYPSDGGVPKTTIVLFHDSRIYPVAPCAATDAT